WSCGAAPAVRRYRSAAGPRGLTQTGGVRRSASRPSIFATRATVVVVAARGSLRSCHRDDGARLADVAAGLVLVAVVHHHLHAIVVARNQPEVVHVPAHLGGVPLVLAPARERIAPVEVRVVLRRILVRRDGESPRRLLVVAVDG